MTPPHTSTEVGPGVTQIVNRLSREKSPYLLQHADNPVDWYPWSEEAFAKARQENKPIFLSIGYSTCHWCHVMAHEEFEKKDVAAIMNREFVNIKVDREERPDVDRVYMTFVQATTGSGGWPMSVWLTPELKPFVGGTYFPPEDRHGQPGFKKVLERIAGAWRQDHRKIAEQGEKIVAALREASNGEVSGGQLDATTLDSAYQQIARSYDSRQGGFGGAPKFPRPVTFNFLFRVYARNRADTKSKEALQMCLFTLRKMAAGGIHDHLGGGFHRYAVDGHWHVPHFEKMLYDQAQLAIAYLEAFQITREPIFESVARDILDYVRRDMTAPGAGFFSAEDADSMAAASDGSTHAHETSEGAFYVWSKTEIDLALGSDSDVFDFRYGILPEGNAPAGSDPQGEFRRKNILIERHTVAETAKQFHKSEDEVGQALQRSRTKLFALRAKRPRPHLDDKIITAWNGLMISAFARAAQILDDPDYLEAGTRAATFARDHLYDKARKVLARSYREGRGIEGFADDYAFLIQGLLDLYGASFDVSWLQLAIELQETQDRLFLDERRGGYFGSAGQDSSILLRMKEDNDSAEPAASSIAALNLLRLAQIRNEGAWRERADKAIAAFTPQISHFPSAMPQMLVALDCSLNTPRQIVIAGKRGARDTRAILAEVYRHFLPNTIVLLADGGEGQKFLEENLEALTDMAPLKGKATAYVCENFACQAPVNTADALRELLAN